MAKNYLSGYTLLDNHLELAFVTNPAEAEPREDEYSEITYFDSTFDRYSIPYSASQPTNPSQSTLPETPFTSPPCVANPAGATT